MKILFYFCNLLFSRFLTRDLRSVRRKWFLSIFIDKTRRLIPRFIYSRWRFSRTSTHNEISWSLPSREKYTSRPIYCALAREYYISRLTHESREHDCVSFNVFCSQIYTHTRIYESLKWLMHTVKLPNSVHLSRIFVNQSFNNNYTLLRDGEIHLVAGKSIIVRVQVVILRKWNYPSVKFQMFRSDGLLGIFRLENRC